LSRAALRVDNDYALATLQSHDPAIMIAGSGSSEQDGRQAGIAGTRQRRRGSEWRL
jgi:hypothetical protein